MPSHKSTTDINASLSRLKPLLLCKAKPNCPQDCCRIALGTLEDESVPSVKLVATQILSLHGFQFSEEQLLKKNLLLAFLQIEEPRRILGFIEQMDNNLLIQFNIGELDLILNRLKKVFMKDSTLFLPLKVFNDFWSCLFYIEVDTWKNWRKIFSLLLDLRRNPDSFPDDFLLRIFNKIHPGLTWMLKIKYQALAVLVAKLPTEVLVESFSDISLQLQSALNLQEISSVTSDLILAYCLRFDGFWHANHEFHEIYRFLVKMLFNADFVTRFRTRALWIPRFLACCELKGFFLQMKQDWRSEKISLLVPIKAESESLWSKQEQSAYGLLLTNKLLNSEFNNDLKELCLNWALYARNQEICKLAVGFMKTHLKEFDVSTIAKTILINFDSGDPELASDLLVIFKLTEFPKEFYNSLFQWMQPDRNLFYLRKSFLVSAFEHFPRGFFEDKKTIFDFLEAASKSTNYGIKEVLAMHRGLAKIYGDELRTFWKEKTVNSRRSELENLELYLEYSKFYNSYLDSSTHKILKVSNETILERFGSNGLGEAIPVTAVVSKFTSERNNGDSVKLNGYAVAKEKSEFVNPLILNCRKLSLTSSHQFADNKKAAKDIAEVILRVKHKKIIDHVSDYFSSFMMELKKKLNENEFSELWEELYSIVKDFYICKNLDCRSLAAWRILLVLLEAIPPKLDEIMTVLLGTWKNSEHEILVIRAGKAIKALISTSFLDTTRYYAEILRNCFTQAEGSFPVASHMGQLTATIAARIFPQDPTLTPVSWFSRKYPELFDIIVELFTMNPSHRGCLQIVGFFQKMIVIRGVCYGEKLKLQLDNLIRSMKIIIANPNSHLRYAVLQCLSQFAVIDEGLGKSEGKSLIKLQLFTRRLKANGPIEMVESKVEEDKDDNIDEMSNQTDHLRYIISMAKSTSIKKRRKGVQMVLRNPNLNKVVKLVGLILFSEDEVDDVLAVYRRNGFITKPMGVLWEFIKQEHFADEQLKVTLKIVQKSVLRYDINQAADGIITDRLMLLKSVLNV